MPEPRSAACRASPYPDVPPESPAGATAPNLGATTDLRPRSTHCRSRPTPHPPAGRLPLKPAPAAPTSGETTSATGRSGCICPDPMRTGPPRSPARPTFSPRRRGEPPPEQPGGAAAPESVVAPRESAPDRDSMLAMSEARPAGAVR